MDFHSEGLKEERELVPLLSSSAEFVEVTALQAIESDCQHSYLKGYMKSEPGTYALLLESRLSAEIQVGRWGRLRVRPGYYVYVGSAFGPGGVRARVARHFRRSKRNHWHIDYLRDVTEVVRAWCSFSPVRLEHEWARKISHMEGVSRIERFGCSDCRCDAHLFAYSRKAVGAALPHAIGGAVESWPYLADA